MSVPLAALQLKPSPFDPVGVLQTAANLGQAQAQSELAKLRMTELQEEAAENRERRGALQGFRAAGGMTNPAALSHLAGHPDAFTPVQTAMTAQQTIAREANARAAQRVASLPEGSPERASAWREELDNAVRERRMSPDAHQRYAAYQQPPQLLLESIIQQGRALPTAAELHRQRIDDEIFGPAQPPTGPAANVAPPGTPRVTVNSAAAPQFEGLLRDLDASGVRVDPSQTGGYNPRNIAGTNTPSLHASGRAVDVNWRDNPEGSLPLPPRGGERFDPNNLVDAAGDRPGQTEIPTELARALARKNGLRSGADFRGRPPDLMHFEAPANGPAPPVSQRGLTTVAGMPPAAAPARAPAPPPAQNPNAPPAPMNLRERVASFTREQQQQIRLLMRDNKTEDALKLIREFSGSAPAPEAIRTQAIKADQAHTNLTTALDGYQALIRQTGAEAWQGQNMHQLGQARRNIQLQLKELFNLGVLNGPDLALMEEMIFDPTVGMGWTGPRGVSNVFSAIGAGPSINDRAAASIDSLKEMLRGIRNTQTQVIGLPPVPPPAGAGNPPPAGAGNPPPAGGGNQPPPASGGYRVIGVR